MRASVLVLAAIAVVAGSRFLIRAVLSLPGLVGYSDPDGSIALLASYFAMAPYVLILAARVGFRTVGLRRPSVDLARWSAIAVFYFGPLVVALATGGFRQPLPIPKLVESGLMAPAEEEMLFRGIVLWLLVPLGVRTAAVGSTLLFGLDHLVNLTGIVSGHFLWTPRAAISAFCDAMLYAAVRIRSGSVYPGMVLHAGNNVLFSVLTPRGEFLNTVLLDIEPFAVLAVGLFDLWSRPGPSPDTRPWTSGPQYRARPARVFVVCLLSGGLAFPFWLARSAAALESAGLDVGMSHWKHALVSLTPLMGALRVRRHFERLEQLGASGPPPLPASALAVMATFAGLAQLSASLVIGAPIGPVLVPPLALFAGALLGVVAATGERALAGSETGP